MLEKTYSTFHANNIVLQTQYREKGFKKYSKLISCLLVAEQNNELLMKNQESRPTGSTPFPEANVTSHNGKKNIMPTIVAEDVVKDVDVDVDMDMVEVEAVVVLSRARIPTRSGRIKMVTNKIKIKAKMGPMYVRRCGGKGHWSRTCRTPKHLVELY
ncbi:uncharacterized protein [Spinacia oleracea]|uniref:CCHC-type domain-containing protein n=1 Tax=Spinacia oleracea TaxID=3562 RepID=A0ABM3REQ3_SPIOL|nr:uncharacterized protein LOC130469146 [Spinacia oleracea]